MVLAEDLGKGSFVGKVFGDDTVRNGDNGSFEFSLFNERNESGIRDSDELTAIVKEINQTIDNLLASRA